MNRLEFLYGFLYWFLLAEEFAVILRKNSPEAMGRTESGRPVPGISLPHGSCSGGCPILRRGVSFAAAKKGAAVSGMFPFDAHVAYSSRAARSSAPPGEVSSSRRSLMWSGLSPDGPGAELVGNDRMHWRRQWRQFRFSVVGREAPLLSLLGQLGRGWLWRV